MINLENQDIDFYKKNGWLKVSSGFSSETLEKYILGAQDLVKKAKKTNYPFRRIYHDYLFDFNLAAVEIPLNKKICNDSIYNFYSNLKLGRAIKKIKGWETPVNTLNRLFCMSNYNYSGLWHKDSFDKNVIAQVCLYLKDEVGFKILLKESEEEVIKKYFNYLGNKDIVHLPEKIPEKYYTEIKASAGDVLFFEPSLLHLGKFKSSRMQFHMRFENIKNLENEKIIDPKNEVFDYNLLEYYSTDLDVLDSSLNIPIDKHERERFFSRFKNSLNYFVPYRNLKSLIKAKILKRNCKYYFFSNTLYQ